MNVPLYGSSTPIARSVGSRSAGLVTEGAAAGSVPVVGCGVLVTCGGEVVEVVTAGVVAVPEEMVMLDVATATLSPSLVVYERVIGICVVTVDFGTIVSDRSVPGTPYEIPQVIGPRTPPAATGASTLTPSVQSYEKAYTPVSSPSCFQLSAYSFPEGIERSEVITNALSLEDRVKNEENTSLMRGNSLNAVIAPHIPIDMITRNAKSVRTL
jgi:hypothetical protein